MIGRWGRRGGGRWIVALLLGLGVGGFGSYPPPPPPPLQLEQVPVGWLSRLQIEGSVNFKHGAPGGSYQLDNWKLEELKPGLYRLRLYLVKKMGKYLNAVSRKSLFLKVAGPRFAIYNPENGKIYLYQWKRILKAKPVKGGWEYLTEIPPIKVELDSPEATYHLLFKLAQ